MTHNSQHAVILSAARTPIGRFQGALSGLSAVELGVVAVHAALERADLPDLAAIDEVMVGNVVSAGLGQNVARQVAIRAGLPVSVGATTVNKVCGSSLKAVMLAAQAVNADEGQLFVVGGVESMSRAPHLVDGRLNQLRYGHTQLRDALIVDGLWCALEDWSMGAAAEFIADEYEVTRAEMDRYALASHQKALAAMDGGKFAAEVVPVTIADRRGEPRQVMLDESPRRETSLAALERLPPAFQANGRVTAGNAPGLNDAASALVVASSTYAHSIGATPLARLAGYNQVAVEPRYLFDAPARVIPRLLNRVGWTLADVDLVEVNEAFAAQMLANGRALADAGWDWDKVNVHGGAIALGHPLGATGARILTTLLYALKDRRLSRGIACLCLGGGEAVGVAVEMME